MLTPREKLIHGSWIIGVLTVAVIVQASLKAAGDDNTATLIGVVTGLVSMVVGIIAIFYSFISNASLGETSSRLHDSSSEIRKSADLVISKLDEIGSKLSPLSEVAKQVSDIHLNMPRAAQGSQSDTNLPPKTANQFANQVVTYFLTSSSWLGLITLYAAIERFKIQKSFNAYSWATFVNSVSPDYAMGYLVCTASTGMITYDQNRFLQEGNIWITHVNPQLLEGISQSVTSNLTRTGVRQEELSLRTALKSQTDNYIKSP